MKAELYQWMEGLALFYILLNMLLYLVPDKKYERYVRLFMGLLLIFMMTAPVFSFLGKGQELAESFSAHYLGEAARMEAQELENLRQAYLVKGYEKELEKKILEALQKKGIEPLGVEVHIEGERAAAELTLEREPDEKQKGGIADVLMEAGGIGEGDFEIKIPGYGAKTVGGSSAFGTPSGSDGSSGENH